jgi:hypothetical protein
VFLIVFKTGHACPLVFTRFFCPRIRRGASAERPGDMNRSWPQTWQFHKLRQNLPRAQARPAPIREQSPSALSPRKQAKHRPVRVHGQTEDLTHRKLAWVVNESYPEPGRNIGPSVFLTTPHRNTEREPRPTGRYNVRRITVSTFSPTYFSIPIQNMSRHVLI